MHDQRVKAGKCLASRPDPQPQLNAKRSLPIKKGPVDRRIPCVANILVAIITSCWRADSSI